MNAWRLQPVFEAGALRVFVVARSECLPTGDDAVCHLVATLAPQAVVVARDGDAQAFDLDGAALGASVLEQRFKGIGAAITAVLA